MVPRIQELLSNARSKVKAEDEEKDGTIKLSHPVPTVEATTNSNRYPKFPDDQTLAGFVPAKIGGRGELLIWHGELMDWVIPEQPKEMRKRETGHPTKQFKLSDVGRRARNLIVCLSCITDTIGRGRENSEVDMQRSKERLPNHEAGGIWGQIPGGVGFCPGEIALGAETGGPKYRSPNTAGQVRPHFPLSRRH
ncbi:hypothetical protein EG329_008882 [Mollisiaceae sp. DMI_Dod_QoI]|nr:hypothetical protein EG329_008882 [Helotiales sp. DMI_Dod_QoI]